MTQAISEHQQHRAEHGEQRRPDAARDVVLQRVHDEAAHRAPPTAAARTPATGVRAIASSSRLACSTSSSGPQPRRPCAGDAPIRGRRAEAQSSYCSGAHISADGVEHVLERRGHDADDRDSGSSSSVICASDDRRIAAEAPPPQRVAEDHDVRRRSADRRRRSKSRPSAGAHAEHAEVAGAHALAVEPLRLGRAGHRRLPGFMHRHRLERAAALGELAIRAERHVERASRRCRSPRSSRSGRHRGYGSGSNRIGLTALKIAVRRADAERQRERRRRP